MILMSSEFNLPDGFGYIIMLNYSPPGLYCCLVSGKSAR